MLNLEKVKQKLSSFDKTKKGGNKSNPQQQEKVKKYIWKPEPGEQVIRIVPLQNSVDFPFTELKFYYNFNGDNINYLSPSSINKPDPIIELANRLQKVRETWKEGKDLLPKSRTYVPIIVRDKEEEGVKLWGFGVQVYQQLLEIIGEFDDITDLNNGYDIKVIFKSAEDAGKDFPETKIVPKAKSRPVIDPEHPKAKEILELITKKQPNIFDIYTPATYEELASALETKLENKKQASAYSSSTTTKKVEVRENDDTVVVEPTEEEIEKSSSTNNNTTTIPVAEVVSPSAQKSKKTTADDFNATFENLFKTNKK